MIIDMGYINKVIRRIFSFALAILGICIILKLSVFYIPFLIAITISMLIEPVIKWITKKTKLERKKSAILVLICVFAIILGLLSIGVTTLISESSNLLSGINDYIDMAYDRIQQFTEFIDFKGFENRGEIDTIVQNSTRNILERFYEVITELLQSVLKMVTSLQ